MARRKIRQGECVFSVAAEVRLPWETIWHDAENAKLKEQRKLPNVLYPGDKLFVPDAAARKDESAPTDNTHTFEAIAPPKTCLRLRLLDDGKPLANVKYRIKFGDRRLRGTTDSDGLLVQPIEPGLMEATLKVHGKADDYRLLIGYLDPVATNSGVQARLENLGFPVGGVDGHWGKISREGMQEFQAKHDLPISSKPDRGTEDALEKEFGS